MSANSLRLHCFGGLWLEGPAGPLSDASSQRRRLALLALVAASGPSGVSRDRVLGCLWPDSDTERARRALAQLVYSMRRSLGCHLLAGEAELRLDPESLGSDVGDFLAAQDDARAAALYAGPFLDGFHLGDAPEFGRWAERQRNRLAGIAQAAIERAARRASDAQDHGLAVELWRRRAALAPLEPAAAIGLMTALHQSGDRGAAIQHARIHTATVRAELEMEPDPRVEALAEQLRLKAPNAPVAASPPSASPAADSANAADSGLPADFGRRAGDTAQASSTRKRRWRVRVSAAFALVAVVAAGVGLWSGRAAAPILAVTDFRFTTADSSRDTHTFTDMLATSLARLDGVQVLSNGRVQEALASLQRGDSAPVTLSRAASAAGATEILEGTVRQAGAGLQAEVRRVDMATGTVRGVYHVVGQNLFELADAATAAVAENFKLTAPATALTAVTTHSLTAYRLYEQGVRLYNLGDATTAYLMFGAALTEDSLFPMAAYYAWRSAAAAALPQEADAYARLRQVQGRGSERERLFIQGTVAAGLMDRSALAIAETLAIRFPSEPDAHLLLGNVRASAGDFAGAIREARLVRQMERQAGPGAADCRTCDAYLLESSSLLAADSLAAAEQIARLWLHDYPHSVAAAGRLAETLERAGRFDEANALLLASDSMGAAPRMDDNRPLIYLIRQGRFAEADSRLRSGLQGTPSGAASARWFLLISLRNQGRFQEALALAREPASIAVLPQPALGYAYFEAGQLRAATAAMDSLAALKSGFRSEGVRARSRSWALTQLATTLAAANDTMRLADVARQLERSGEHSLYGRDRIAFHYADALLLIARGDDANAERELRAAIYSPTEGFSRVNFELGRLYLRQNRPREAVTILSAALRGPIEASSYYVTQTEVRELLAKACDMLGLRDSAVEGHRQVAAAWANADAPFRARGTLASRRVDELLATR